VELFSSPIVTYQSETATADQDQEVVSVNRVEHLCDMLESRLGIENPCGLEAQAAPLTSVQTTANTIALGLPLAGYSRGAEGSTQTTDPSIFYRSGLENLCITLAPQVVDGSGPYSSTDPTDSIKSMVTTLMGLTPTDTRTAGIISVLTNHYQKAISNGSKANLAMQSTFVLACTSPAVAAVGL
jgi:hypothetical protein